MGTIVKPHAHSDGAVARPDHVNENVDILYNEINGNLDFENLKAALQNAANGLVKLDASALVPLAQIPVLTADKLPTVIPSGVIVMWSGTLGTIPAGWSLCDGTGETPDLRDKFIYGCSDGEDPGGTGGAATHTHAVGTLSAEGAAAHTHSVNPPATNTGEMSFHGTCSTECTTTGNNNEHNHSVNIAAFNSVAGGAHTHTISGASAAGSTLPPYFKLAFIMKD